LVVLSTVLFFSDTSSNNDDLLHTSKTLHINPAPAFFPENLAPIPRSLARNPKLAGAKPPNMLENSNLRLLSSLDFDGNVNQAIFLLIHTFVSFAGGCVILLGSHV